jgi:DNA-binding NarL/FixJ family response regulator
MRILLDGMPQMLRTIIKDILSADPECEIVAEAVEQNKLGAQLSETPADVIILAVADLEAISTRLAALLAQYPATRIIAITSGGNRAFLYDLRPHVTPINELSPATLLSAIRQSPAWAPSGA